MSRRFIHLASVLVLSVLCVGYASAGIVYVDATFGDTGNTTLAAGGTVPTVSGDSGSDNSWRLRAFGNDATILEAGGQYGDGNTEDCPRLVTAVAVPEGKYRVYAYIWSDGGPWCVRAALANSDANLPLFAVNAGNAAVTLAQATDFAGAVPMLTEGNRTLWQVYVGDTASTSTITVFVDDDAAHLSHTKRTWYDGIGYTPLPPQIIWVSDNKGYNQTNVTPPVDPNKAADHGFVDLLRAQGYDVVYKNENSGVTDTAYWRTLDAGKIAELEAADLIILSRNADSGSYSTAADNEPNQWNAVTTPILSMSAHMSRIGGKWGWLNGTATFRAKEAKMRVKDAAHPVFAGVAMDPNLDVTATSDVYNMDWVTGVTDAGNGKILASRPSDGLVSIVEWQAGQKFLETGTAVAGGLRMLFVAGTGSGNNSPAYSPDGAYNLTAEGKVMFCNAVRYMLGQQPPAIALTNASFEEPAAKQQTWDGGTNAKGTFVDVPGWSSDTMAQDSGIEGPNAWPGTTDGVMSGYLMGTDPAVWNVTAHAIDANDIFVLYVDARDNWTADAAKPTALQITLFGDASGVRIPLVTSFAPLATTWMTFEMPLRAKDFPTSAGLNIGVELKNASNATETDNSWIGIDNIRLFNVAPR